MKINIYYGGRGLMDDPTLFVLNKMKEVLEELRVTVETFHLYDLKNSITRCRRVLKRPTVLSLAVRWSGTGSAAICTSSWIPAGCMEIRK